MVSQRTVIDATSRGRLLAAAAVEFAARGFDGAKVDRIAARARINKAMVYYHFKNKAALYRAILLDLFGSLAVALAISREQGGTPEDQLRRFVRTIAAETASRPHFPSIWLREMAEGGRHLDRTIVQPIGAILGVLAAILRDGVEHGVFGAVHPLIAQMNIVGPLLLFSASAPVRERFQHAVPSGLNDVGRADLIAHVETGVLAIVGAVPAHPSAQTTRAKRSRR
jgi:TetR/AcrR family transcriptional regulator